MRFTVLVLMLLVMLSGSQAQTIQSVRFKVSVSSSPLSISPGEIELEGLQVGTTYSTVPDGAGSLVITPNDGNALVVNSAETSISGDLNGKILVSFVLPSHLYPINGTGQGFIVTRFTSNSAAWGPSGAENNYFDPKIPVSISLDATGRAYVSLGGIFEVPYNAGDDTYVGEALLTAQYTGL